MEILASGVEMRQEIGQGVMYNKKTIGALILF
jgi:hypothetical protein